MVPPLVRGLRMRGHARTFALALAWILFKTFGQVGLKTVSRSGVVVRELDRADAHTWQDRINCQSGGIHEGHSTGLRCFRSKRVSGVVCFLSDSGTISPVGL